jgi:hypothetical protein
MSERDDDFRLERELRELLRGRDPGPAPYGLRGRVDRVPEERPGRDTALARLVPFLGIAAVVALAALAIGAIRTVGPTPGPGGSTVPAASFDPYLVGPGTVALLT